MTACFPGSIWAEMGATGPRGPAPLAIQVRRRSIVEFDPGHPLRIHVNETSTASERCFARKTLGPGNAIPLSNDRARRPAAVHALKYWTRPSSEERDERRERKGDSARSTLATSVVLGRLRALSFGPYSPRSHAASR